jgi:hypothetical protein
MPAPLRLVRWWRQGFVWSWPEAWSAGQMTVRSPLWYWVTGKM